MAEFSCRVSGCVVTKHKGHGMCSTHHRRWRTEGKPPLPPLPPPPSKLCTIEGCGRPYHSNGYCGMHHRRWYVHGDPHFVKVVIQPGRVCKYPPCNQPHKAKGYCGHHWRKVRDNGTPEDIRLTLAERYWAQVVEDPSGCWLWTGRRMAKGYGSFQIGYARMTSAHRWAYEFMVGCVPDGLELDHVCHNQDLTCSGGNDCPHRRCVNPWHLEPVTHAVNLGRAAARRRTIAVMQAAA